MDGNIAELFPTTETHLKLLGRSIFGEDQDITIISYNIDCLAAQSCSWRRKMKEYPCIYFRVVSELERWNITWFVGNTFACFHFWRVNARTIVTPVVDGHKNSKHNMYCD